MHLIAYASDFVTAAGPRDKVVQDIVEVAKRENRSRHITGVLFYFKDKFLQVIEGEEAELRQLMQNIEMDPRHRDIQYLVDAKVESRGFNQWNMDSFNLEDDKNMDFETLKKLTDSFKRNLLPRSDMLVFYYKTLLGLEDKYKKQG